MSEMGHSCRFDLGLSISDPARWQVHEVATAVILGSCREQVSSYRER